MACGVVVAWRVIFCMSGGYVNRVPPKGSTRFGEVAGGQGVGRQGVARESAGVSAGELAGVSPGVSAGVSAGEQSRVVAGRGQDSGAGSLQSKEMFLSLCDYGKRFYRD